MLKSAVSGIFRNPADIRQVVAKAFKFDSNRISRNRCSLLAWQHFEQMPKCRARIGDGAITRCRASTDRKVLEQESLDKRRFKDLEVTPFGLDPVAEMGQATQITSDRVIGITLVA